jgi:hypothetical protein
MTTVEDFLSQMQAYGQDISGGGPVDMFEGGWGRSSAPFVIGRSAKTASDITSERFDAALRAYAEQAGAGERARSDSLGWALGESGVAPTQAAQLIAEGDQGYLTGVAGARASLEVQEADVQTGLVGEAASGLIQSEQYQDYLDQQRWLAEKALEAQRKAGKRALVAQYVGMGVGMLAGGGVGAGIMGTMGSMYSKSGSHGEMNEMGQYPMPGPTKFGYSSQPEGAFYGNGPGHDYGYDGGYETSSTPAQAMPAVNQFIADYLKGSEFPAYTGSF